MLDLCSSPFSYPALTSLPFPPFCHSDSQVTSAPPTKSPPPPLLFRMSLEQDAAGFNSDSIKKKEGKKKGQCLIDK